MYEIRYVTTEDRESWFRLDRHLPADEYDKKVRDRQGYVLFDEKGLAGILRFNLFWDNTPFCTLLYIREDCRGIGYGRKLMENWEEDMRSRGFGMVLTSTQTDENAQHFYRRLGYHDCGGLICDLPGYEQPMEMFLNKLL